MKPEQQRIAIAEACGWRHLWQTDVLEWRGTDPSGTGDQYIPDYPCDLNAMHEAEKVLTSKQLATYFDHLCTIVIDGTLTPHGCVWYATAAQRAEAFLKTLGLWNESSAKGESPAEPLPE